MYNGVLWAVMLNNSEPEASNDSGMRTNSVCYTEYPVIPTAAVSTMAPKVTPRHNRKHVDGIALHPTEVDSKGKSMNGRTAQAIAPVANNVLLVVGLRAPVDTTTTTAASYSRCGTQRQNCRFLRQRWLPPCKLDARGRKHERSEGKHVWNF